MNFASWLFSSTFAASQTEQRKNYEENSNEDDDARSILGSADSLFYG